MLRAGFAAIAAVILAALTLQAAHSAADGTVAKVVVHVTGADTGKPLEGQRVYLVRRGSLLYDIFTAYTNSDGDASFVGIFTSGTYDVEAYGDSRHDVARATVQLSKYGSTERYDVALVLPGYNSRINRVKPSPPGDRELDIHVRGRKADGSVVAVHYASIYDRSGRAVAMTDYNGNATIRHSVPLGESYTFSAEANHWKTATESFTSGASSGVSYRSGLTARKDGLTFTLEPEKTGAPLVVEVLDHDTDQPVAGAGVTLAKPTSFFGTPVGNATTDAKGEATFSADLVAEAQLNGQAKVVVTVQGYGGAIQNVAAELLSGDAPRYVVYVKPLPRPDPGWEGDYLDGTASIHIMISGGTVRGSWANTFGGDGTQSDSGNFECPNTVGSQAHCTYTAVYDDKDKTIGGRKGTLVLELSGDSIGVSLHEISDSCAPKAPHQSCSESDLGYTPADHPGADMMGRWTRVHNQ